MLSWPWPSALALHFLLVKSCILIGKTEADLAGALAFASLICYCRTLFPSQQAAPHHVPVLTCKHLSCLWSPALLVKNKSKPFCCLQNWNCMTHLQTFGKVAFLKLCSDTSLFSNIDSFECLALSLFIKMIQDSIIRIPFYIPSCVSEYAITPIISWNSILKHTSLESW